MILQPPVEPLYRELWSGALAAFGRGAVEIDPHLAHRRADGRLGLSVIARPDADTLERLADIQHALARIEPDQHHYRPDEIHITVLSLFTATENCAPYFARAHLYQEAVRAALDDAGAFSIRLCGITASPSSVMVQGYPEDDELERLRGRLRAELTARGLGSGLDERYRVISAHCTVMRMATKPRDLERLVGFLSSHRKEEYGRWTVRSVQFVKNDWYMSHDRVELLAEYPLGAPR